MDTERRRQSIRDMLDSYVDAQVDPGGFLTAVLANDLQDAVDRADGWSLWHIRWICRHVWSRLPSVCHGSRDAVKDWLQLDPAEHRAIVGHDHGRDQQRPDLIRIHKDSL